MTRIRCSLLFPLCSGCVLSNWLRLFAICLTQKREVQLVIHFVYFIELLIEC